MSGPEPGGLRDRLRRLRRDAPVGEVAEENGGEPEEASATASFTSGAPAELASAEGPRGAFLARSASLAATERHGDFELSEVAAARGADLELLTGDAALSKLDLEGAVYLDTETTGLSGGAGTYVFLVGLGSFRGGTSSGGAFECWQGFLSGPGDEEALLAECARRIRDSSGVVSFFGKSFDRHRLEDKMRQHGVEPPFDDRPHLDLYHPCRRLYRAAYEDGRLKTMERELCGVEREDDLPGSRAPEAWFDFLAGREHRLEGVFRHNRDDVLSLVTLAAHLGRSRLEERGDGRPLGGDGASRALGLARSLDVAGRRGEALPWLDRALERGARPRRSVELERAHLLRLEGRAVAALEAYRAIVGGPEDACSVPALLELAKLLEHHARKPAEALECCRLAATVIDRQHTGSDRRRLARDLERRTRRLESK